MGQEQDGSLLFSWIQQSKNQTLVTKIGLYLYSENLTIIHTFNSVVNCIQASIDSTKTYLVYVIKQIDAENVKNFSYQPFLLKINTQEIFDLGLVRSKQTFAQFLYQKHSVLSESCNIKFLILIHQECKSIAEFLFYIFKYHFRYITVSD